MTRNELFEAISELIDSGAVAYEITAKTRNKLLDEIVVEYGGASSITISRNAMLERILELAP